MTDPRNENYFSREKLQGGSGGTAGNNTGKTHCMDISQLLSTPRHHEFGMLSFVNYKYHLIGFFLIFHIFTIS